MEDDGVLGEYRVRNICILRAEATMTSKGVGELEAGEIISVTESATLDNGTIRLKCSNGWLSLKDHLVEKIGTVVAQRGAVHA